VGPKKNTGPRQGWWSVADLGLDSAAAVIDGMTSVRVDCPN
jgi:hypothetical protein